MVERILDAGIGTRVCMCPVCGEIFTCVYNFDKHRIGSFNTKDPAKQRRCRTPEEMEKVGLRKNAKGRWCTPRNGETIQAVLEHKEMERLREEERKAKEW